MVTTHYFKQQELKSGTNPCQTTREKQEPYRRLDNVFGYELEARLSGVMPVLQSLNYKLQRRLSGVLPNTSKVIKKYVLAIEKLDTSYATFLYYHNLV